MWPVAVRSYRPVIRTTGRTQANAAKVRLGDARPHTTTIAAAAGATVPLPAICLLSTHAGATVVLVALLGFFGLGANPVLISLSVRFAGDVPTLAPALSVSAFNVGTAAGSWITGRALDSTLGATGPAVVGAAIAALTLIPTITIAVIQRRRSAPPAHQLPTTGCMARSAGDGVGSQDARTSPRDGPGLLPRRHHLRHTTI
ncbi:hypothetical protein AB0B56_07475 [Streptosporangium canum]|jgi:DHA1 family inner membrane transport protein|uniref:hypothetical protein n=1 Tax=Streptosporangium canum TaxID=324952 RepID=UPI003423A08F